MPSLDLPKSLQVSQLIPHATTGRVSKSLQRFSGWLHILLCQLQVVVYLIEDFLAGGLYANMLERELIVGNGKLVVVVVVVVGVGFEEQRGEEMELLRDREDQRPQGGYVGLESMPSHFHHIFAD